MQAAKLENGGHKVVRCPSDANTEIVSVTLDIASNEIAVIVRAEDAYIFQLLLYFWNSDLSNMSMRSEPRKNHWVKMQTWGDCQLHLVKSKILAFTEKNTLTLKICSVFDKADPTREEIGVV